MSNRRVRHDLDLVLVRNERDQTPTRGRIVQWEDGRWRLVVTTGADQVELHGDRWTESRPVVLLLLRQAADAA